MLLINIYLILRNVNAVLYERSPKSSAGPQLGKFPPRLPFPPGICHNGTIFPCFRPARREGREHAKKEGRDAGQSRTVFSLLPVILRSRMAVRGISRGRRIPVGLLQPGPPLRALLPDLRGGRPGAGPLPAKAAGPRHPHREASGYAPARLRVGRGHRDGDRAHRQLHHGIHDGRLDVGLPRVPAEFSGADRAPIRASGLGSAASFSSTFSNRCWSARRAGCPAGPSPS